MKEPTNELIREAARNHAVALVSMLDPDSEPDEMTYHEAMDALARLLSPRLANEEEK